MERPLPAPHLHEIGYQIEPAMDVWAWAKQMFIDEGAEFCNPDFEHLRRVDIAVLFTNVEYEDGLMPVAGMAEIVNVNGKPWARAERIDHLCLMHGNIPQARIWLYAPFWAMAEHETACALFEHELYHYAHKRDKSGDLMFDDLDRPVLTKREHDVTEFIQVVRRYGVGAVHPNVQLMVEAAQAEPLISRAQVAAACGTCYAHI